MHALHPQSGPSCGEPQAGEQYVRSKALIVIGIAVLIACSGIRFSDGSVLLAISRGATVADPVFSNPAAQYVLDSPLKVALLRLLPARTTVIALAFSALAFLPLCTLLTRMRGLVWLTLTVVFLTPAFRVSIQNIGVGDGLVILLLLVSIHTTTAWVLFCAFLLIGLWHPQQSLFMGLSFAVAEHCYRERPDRKKIFLMLGGLGLACAVFLVYRTCVPFGYHGRAAYMNTRGLESLAKNLPFVPIAVVPSLLWFTLIRPPVVRRLWLQRTWIALIVCVSLLTADVTRVITLLLLPIVLCGAHSLYEARATLSRPRLVVCAIAVLLTPVVSWSGLDLFLWTDVVDDLHKWGFLN